MALYTKEIVLFKKTYGALGRTDYYEKGKLYELVEPMDIRMTGVRNHTTNCSWYIPNEYFYTPKETIQQLRILKIRNIRNRKGEQ